MLVFFVCLFIAIAGAVLYGLYNNKFYLTTHCIKLGRSEYVERVQESFQDFIFHTDTGKRDYTFKYDKVIFTDNEKSLEFKNDDILLFDTKICPNTWRGHYVLMEKITYSLDDVPNTYRIAQCIADGYNMPDLYDGSETPGIGYNIIGFLKYKISKSPDKKVIFVNKYF